MSDMVDKLSEKLSCQYKQLNQNVEKLAKAGKGLFLRAKETGSKQFYELVATGEKSETDLIVEMRETVKQPFNDIKGSVSKAKFASRGLFMKVRENGNKYFEELVVEGERKNTAKSAPSSAKSTKKSSSKAA